MGDILAKLREVHGSRSMVAVDVPEYGWTFYFPPMTLADRAACRHGVNPEDETELMVSTLIHMARNEDGSQFFDRSPEIRAELQRMDFAVLMRVIAESGGSSLSAEVAAEFAKLKGGGLRRAMTDAVSGYPALFKLLSSATDADVLDVLREFAVMLEGRKASKND